MPITDRVRPNLTWSSFAQWDVYNCGETTGWEHTLGVKVVRKSRGRLPSDAGLWKRQLRGQSREIMLLHSGPPWSETMSARQLGQEQGREQETKASKRSRHRKRRGASRQEQGNQGRQQRTQHRQQHHKHATHQQRHNTTITSTYHIQWRYRNSTTCRSPDRKWPLSVLAITS